MVSFLHKFYSDENSPDNQPNYQSRYEHHTALHTICFRLLLPGRRCPESQIRFFLTNGRSLGLVVFQLSPVTSTISELVNPVGLSLIAARTLASNAPTLGPDISWAAS